MEKIIVDRRRDLVRHLHGIGLSVLQIIERIEGHFELFPSTATYKQKRSIIDNDIIEIRNKVMADIAIDTFDAKEKHAEYVEQQKFLYYKAVQDGDYTLAERVSKNIAKAYGINTEEPIVIKSDILTVLSRAREDFKKRKEIEETKAIDVTPEASETREEVPIRLPADAILTKR